MKIPIYQVDAFTSEIFKGNPAAVCPLKNWLPEKVMQEIAKTKAELSSVTQDLSSDKKDAKR